MNDDITSSLATLQTDAPVEVIERVLVGTGSLDYFTAISWRHGTLWVSWNGHGVSCVAPGQHPDAFFTTHDAKVGRERRSANSMPPLLLDMIENTLETGVIGGLPIDLRGVAEFQQDVLMSIRAIPPGELRTYAWVARQMGKPKAARAVGNALNANPVPVLIPCHRVGRSDGSVGQYAFGPEMKRQLLHDEGLDISRLDRYVDRNIRYLGSKNYDAYCFPSCRTGKRMPDVNRVEFKDRAAAEAAGYRPCKVCKP